MTERSLLSLQVEEFLSAVAARTPAPGGGASAAVVTALAAGLVGMAARYAGDAGDTHNETARWVELADDLRRRAAPLADADAEAYGRYLDATRMSGETDPDRRRRGVDAALSEATDVPVAISELAADVAGLAADLAANGNRRLRGDAATGGLLASAAATAASMLVAENLSRVGEDPRRARAAGAAARAEAAAAAVVELLGPHGDSQH